LGKLFERNILNISETEQLSQILCEGFNADLYKQEKKTARNRTAFFLSL